MMQVIAGLLYVALTVLAVVAAVFAFARGVMWWESRRPVPVANEAWEYSDREGDGGRAA